MEITAKNSIDTTTLTQLQKLVDCMKEHPYLATGSPQFDKAATEQTWETVAKEMCNYGFPARSGDEWKRVWADIRCQVEKKITQNNESLHKSSGEPCLVTNLTELESDIDRICHISDAADLNRKKIGFLPKRMMIAAPTRRGQKVAIVKPTPSSVELKKVSQKETFSPSPPTTRERKRKRCESYTEGHKKLLREQVETLKAIQSHVEVTKECVTAVKDFADALKSQSASLILMTESIKMMTATMFDVVKNLTKE